MYDLNTSEFVKQLIGLGMDEKQAACIGNEFHSLKDRLEIANNEIGNLNAKIKEIQEKD